VSLKITRLNTHPFMPSYPDKIDKLIQSFAMLPGIGRKTAERFVFYLLKQPKTELAQFASNLADLHDSNFSCPQCHNFSHQEGLCEICSDQKREPGLICVVEEIHDLNIIENTREFNGHYHVLGGKIDPIEGVSADKLTINTLFKRIKENNITEIIFALNPDIQGEGTILYLKNLLQPLGVKITLLARGLPMGSDIEYADEITLTNALRGRQELR